MSSGGDSFTLLVAGAHRVDAGKTTFSAGLVARTGAVGFKPRAGNDYWFSHDDVTTALDQGRLYGKDAKTLAEASPGSFDPEDINPIHRLWTPSPGGGSGLLGQDGREFVVDRVGDHLVVNGTVDVPEVVREQLPIADAIRVDSLDAFNQVMEQYHLRALDGVQQTVSATERAVVESYSDIARPIQGISPDAVAVVEPRRARFFDGQRYTRACEIATNSPREGRLEERVEAVVDLLDPAGVADLPPLDSATRGESAAIEEAYGHAYDELLDLAQQE